jgi:hypothetical protein
MVKPVSRTMAKTTVGIGMKALTVGQDIGESSAQGQAGLRSTGPALVAKSPTLVL